ncbi:hypothetical protein JTE90_020377 [Oedothorax gibbosus]|uniref:Uncharacterized protein n=1 Tax=Oedothorax gibbosus TaxID=931172 RepID=A0AAV6TR39_9ARAC|nr:hypothetical protein JTE90_020377 [Oedothorax gibbosus]
MKNLRSSASTARNFEAPKSTMADDQRLLTGEDRSSDKRKCDDFASLYGLEGSSAGSRNLSDHSGKHPIFPPE